MKELTQILRAMEAGEAQATEQLLALVYEGLRNLAAQKLAQEQPGQTLDATGLAHEAYLRLCGGQPFENRRHFFAAAAEAMRRILVDRARARTAVKRGGARRRLRLDQLALAAEFLALHEALDRLTEQHPRKGELVKLRFFAGLTGAEAAAALGISSSTADNDWAYARAWLRLEIERS
jgi:RNA polymerase sigma factor (TIGR02999 family)